MKVLNVLDLPFIFGGSICFCYNHIKTGPQQLGSLDVWTGEKSFYDCLKQCCGRGGVRTSFGSAEIRPICHPGESRGPENSVS